MKKQKKTAPFILAFSLMLLSLPLLNGCSKKPGSYDPFAKCLTEKGVIMYGTEWCPHCKNQKAAFGNSFEYVNYIDCDKNRDACIRAGVQGYPTWVIDGKSYPGEQPLFDLSSLAGCPM